MVLVLLYRMMLVNLLLLLALMIFRILFSEDAFPDLSDDGDLVIENQEKM